MVGFFYLIVAFCLNALGTIFVKVHAVRGFSLKGNPLELISKNIFFLLALSCFALNLVAYALALRRLPLSVGYPVMTVASFVIVNMFSFLYFKEFITGMQIFGYVLILIGIFLVIYFAVEPVV